MALASPVRCVLCRGLARRVAGLSLVVAGLLLVATNHAPHAAKRARAEDDKPAPRQVGRLLRIPLPITGNADTQVKRAVQKALTEIDAGDSRPVLVFQFAGGENRTGQGSEFTRALELADFLSSRELGEVKTVAYITGPLKGHAVLVAMACEEIIMAPEASIGQAGIDEPAEEPIDPTVRSGYYDIANRRRTIPAQVAAAMLDKNIEVIKVETEVSTEYPLRSELDEFKKTHTVQSEQVLNRPGQFAQFSGREARDLSFVKYLAPDRKALASALSLEEAMLEDDPSRGDAWRAVIVPLKGPITPQLATRVRRMIEDQIRDNDANFICLWIDSPGGSLKDSMDLANYLADIDSAKVRTVAYVPAEARADAALIAMACDQLAMAPDATLGGSGAANISPEEVLVAREMLRDHLGPAKARSWSLTAALIDPDARVFRYTNKRDGAVEYFSEAEHDSQGDPDDWLRGDEVTTPGRPLRIKGDAAAELGLTRATVDDFPAFKQTYDIEDELVLAEPGWAHFLIDFLASQAVGYVLLFVGLAALYAEAQAPGIGVGAFVAGICFLLFFWSRYLEGTAGWLEVLLFLGGVGCILLELFVLPGVAIFGLGGGLMIILSLILASQTFVLPQNDYQLAQLRDSLLGLIGAGVGVVLVAMLMRRYLPHTPFFSHVVLEPPSDAELEDLAHREAIVDFNHLLGHQGVSTTQLTPSGKARFGNELVAVTTDGEVIGRGTEVVVVEVHGNRVVVQAANKV